MPLAINRNGMKTTFETYVKIRLESLVDQHITHGERAFTSAAHQLPIGQRHCRCPGVDRSRNHVRVAPIRIDFGDARNAGTHGHDLGGAI